MYKRDFFKRKYDHNKSRNDFIEYRKIRNSITSMIRTSKQKYFSEVSNKYKNNPKKMWNELNKVSGKNSKGDDIPTEINSEMMNDYFANVGKEMNKSYTSNNIEWKHPNCLYELVFTKIDPEDLLKLLLKISSSNNLDVLDLDSKHLRLAAPYIHQSICEMFNMSLSSGSVPDDWKT